MCRLCAVQVRARERPKRGEGATSSGAVAALVRRSPVARLSPPEDVWRSCGHLSTGILQTHAMFFHSGNNRYGWQERSLRLARIFTTAGEKGLTHARGFCSHFHRPVVGATSLDKDPIVGEDMESRKQVCQSPCAHRQLDHEMYAAISATQFRHKGG